MEPLIFVMAILGCGESDAACREIAVAETRYQSEAACLAATEQELLRRDDLVYPSIVAQCRRAGAQPQPVRGSDVILPDPVTVTERQPRFADATPRPRGR